MNGIRTGKLNRKVCGWLARVRIAAVGDSYTGADPMDATPGGRRLATPRGNTL